MQPNGFQTSSYCWHAYQYYEPHQNTIQASQYLTTHLEIQFTKTQAAGKQAANFRKL